MRVKAILRGIAAGLLIPAGMGVIVFCEVYGFREVFSLAIAAGLLLASVGIGYTVYADEMAKENGNEH